MDLDARTPAGGAEGQGDAAVEDNARLAAANAAVLLVELAVSGQ